MKALKLIHEFDEAGREWYLVTIDGETKKAFHGTEKQEAIDHYELMILTAKNIANAGKTTIMETVI